jgi:TolB-like protein/DNA-binding winged helix-turn-helix (wHTH) protein/Flp pilus assembly protein TadD
MNNETIQISERLLLDLARGCLVRDGKIVHLRPLAYEVLRFLLQNEGRLISKDKLIEQVWQGRAVTDGSLGKCIEEIREALGEDSREYLRNVRGRGYIFDPGGEESPDRHMREPEQAEMAAALSQGPDTRLKNVKRRKLAALVAAAVLIVALFAVFRYFDSPSETVTSIAVLPFDSSHSEPDMEYLSDGIADRIIDRLSQLPGFRVMSRHSVNRYRARPVDVQELARELNVDAVLTGRVVQRSDMFSVSVELVNAKDNTHIWGEHYSRRLTDLVSLQGEIARDVSRKLHLRISPVDERKLAKNYTANIEAYKLYLMGRYFFFKSTQQEIRKAIDLYRQAIEVDPGYALAFAGIADAHRTLAIVGDEPSKEAFPRAKAAANRALEIDEDLAEAHTVLGWVGFMFDWDWKGAENRLKRALELNPNDPNAHRAYAHLLSNQGRHDEAVRESRRSLELDPLTLIANALEGQFLFYAGRNDEAIAQFKRTLEIDPNYWVAHNGLGRVYILEKKFPEAVAALTQAKDLAPGSFEPITQLGYALARSGKSELAQEVLEELKSSAAKGYVPAYNFAMIYNGLGETDLALNYLERSLEEHEEQIIFVRIDRRWDGLRSDPRFRAIMHRVGL